MSDRLRTGGRILVDALLVHGADRLFCVPGESYLDVLDALYDSPEIDVVVAKHEGAAANMAEADGKLTGRPGLCCVTRGPGATHASVGVHTAMQDSTPMILFIGQVERGFRDREGFQEVDYRAMFAPLAKWVAEIDSAARIPEYLARAFQCATSGRPGPVVLSLPEDMLADTVAVADTRRYTPVQAAPRDADMATLRNQLLQARAPLLVLGGSSWPLAATAAIQRFAESFSLPVAASFRRQDLFDNAHDNFAGHLALGISPTLAARVVAADLLIVVGARLNEIATGGYQMLTPPNLAARLIHIHPDPSALSRVYQADLPIASGVENAALALAALAAPGEVAWRGLAAAMHAEFVRFASPGAVAAPPRGVDMAAATAHLSQTLPGDAIVTNGAGNFTVWLHRFYRYRQPHTELAPTSGSMGYALPAALAAKRRFPERTVVCVAGDGEFLMYPQELATALQFNAAIVVLVVNNAMYGTIRMHQERRFPGRISATRIEGPDLVALAQAFGAYAERVERTDAFGPAFARAVAAGRPALLELVVDPDQITPTLRLSAP